MVSDHVAGQPGALAGQHGAALRHGGDAVAGISREVGNIVNAGWFGSGAPGGRQGRGGCRARRRGWPCLPTRALAAAEWVAGREAGQRARRDRGGDRVLGAGLHGGGQPEQVRLGHAGGGEHVGQRHPAGREGAGLVERHGVHPAGVLQDLGALDQDAELRAAAGADQDRGRRGQAHRARAGDDQHRDGGGERPRRRRSRGQPAGQRRGGEHQHGRDEDRADAVGQALHGRLARLRLGDEPGELGQLGVRPDPGGADHQAAADVHAAAGHRVALADLGRHRLAGQHRRVKRGAAGDDDAIGGDLLPRPDHELVADARAGRRGG